MVMSKIQTPDMNRAERKMTEKEQILDQMSKEDMKRFKEQKAFERITPKSSRWKVLLEVDQLRRKLVLHKRNIAQRLWEIENLHTSVRRKKVQLKTGKITEELKTGILMNEHELEITSVRERMVAEATAKDVIAEVANIAGLVGLTDVARGSIITEEEFDEYVNETEKELKRMGYELFSLVPEQSNDKPGKTGVPAKS